jgi:AcrR family transcriptional regulator
MGRKAVATRERILTAAEDIVLVDGVATLTLEKAAARAGVSKGGVLYHFGTRNELVSAMAERTVQQFEAAIEEHRRLHPEAGFPRAYVAECLAEPADEQEQRSMRIGAALVAAVAAQPDLLRPLQQAFTGWQARIAAEASDPVTATIARLAADGLWLCEMFGIDGISPDLRRQVEAELLRMAGP